MSLKPYPAYKSSGQQWLGEVPNHWEIRPSKSVFGLRNEPEKSGDVHLTPSQSLGVLPQSEYMKVTGSRVVLALAGTRMKHVEVNDFVIHLRSFQGGIEWSGCRGKVSPAYTVLKPSAHVVPAFFRYCLKSRGYIETIASLTDQLRDGQSMRYYDFGKTPLPLPPENEQQDIVTFLDRETAEIDAFVADQEQLIALLSERRTATITQAVTRGLNPCSTLKESGVEYLDQIPERWNTLPLRHLIDTPLKYGANEPADAADPGDVRYLRITDFDLLGKLRDDTFRSLRPEVASPYMVSPGDVLLARSGATVGKAFIVPDDAPPSCFAGYLIRANVSKDKILPEFFFAYTQSSAFEAWKNLVMVQATIQNIGADKYANLTVPIPPLDEQRQICKYLDAEIHEIDSAIADAREAIALSKERRAAVISAAVTGKIDVRGLVAPAANNVEGVSVGVA